jgi:hypothetical protein
MIEAVGLIGLGVLMLLLALFRHYHDSWSTPWQFARWGLLLILLGFASFFVEAWLSNGKGG